MTTQELQDKYQDQLGSLAAYCISNQVDVTNEDNFKQAMQDWVNKGWEFSKRIMNDKRAIEALYNNAAAGA